MSRAPVKRCAIYTRKSSEEGLEQDFNSLAAQREACEAYIVSQRGEGWTAIPELYDDGGFSGGNLNRPALQRLLKDIEAGRIDIVVVYKVDRLTRALTDFARLIEQFDARRVSVVAVTQPFNTTTSMGRLTLNVLLSFAQFEREITGERIRDKIAASKQKGMWMGGYVPLGYDLSERTLKVNPEEAGVIRMIFSRYHELESVRLLRHSLERDGIRSKQRVSARGRASGGKPFSRGALYTILRSRLYVGEISHQGSVYPGQHQGIVEPELFDAVQAKLDSRRHGVGSRLPSRSLLAGKLFDAEGNRISPSHAKKGNRRYRYYVSQAVMHGGKSRTRARWPAEALESFIRSAVAKRIRDVSAWLTDSNSRTLALEDAAAGLADTIAGAREGMDEFTALLRKVVLLEDSYTLNFEVPSLRFTLKLPDEIPIQPDWSASLTVRNRRNGRKQILNAGSIAELDIPQVGALVDAHQWYWGLLAGRYESIAAIARENGRDIRYMKRLLTLVYIAPDLKRAILDGG